MLVTMSGDLLFLEPRSQRPGRILCPGKHANRGSLLLPKPTENQEFTLNCGFERCARNVEIRNGLEEFCSSIEKRCLIDGLELVPDWSSGSVLSSVIHVSWSGFQVKALKEAVAYNDQSRYWKAMWDNLSDCGRFQWSH